MSQNLRKPKSLMYLDPSLALTMGLFCGVNSFKILPKEEPCDTTYGDSTRNHEAAIRKADKKRAMRNAKRLKNWNK